MTALVLACTAILFDCDGVLVDSDASVSTAWSRWAVDHGFDPDAVLDSVHGRRSADTVAAWVDEAQRAESLQNIDRYEVEDAAAVRAIPGAAALLASIPSGRWAVVTSGTRPLARARLASAGLPIPDVLITADDVTHGKPHPEGYAAAATGLGVDPAQAVVVEDAAAGMAAGRAAGVHRILGVGERAAEGRPDALVADLRQVRWSPDGLHVTTEAAS